MSQPLREYTQKIWEVHDMRLGAMSYNRLAVGNDYDIVFEQALVLTKIPREYLSLVDTGRTKDNCKTCGKR